MYEEIIEQLVKAADGSTCISLIVPLQKTLPGRKQNPIVVKNAINEIETKLDKTNSQDQLLIKALDQLLAGVDLEKQHVEGVGIFLNQHIQKLVEFTFPVNAKQVVDDSFEIRDLLYGRNRFITFWVLSLDNKKTRLFQGSGNRLKEIKDKVLPLAYEEQYQYPDRQKPRVSGDYQSEETQIVDERLRQYFRHVNKQINPYLAAKPLPIVLTGVKSHHTIFDKIFNYKKHVVARIYGNYEHLSEGEMANMIWPKVKQANEDQRSLYLKDIEDQVGKKGYLYGIEAVWQVAQEGRADLLIVEKDYSHPAYRDLRTGRMLFNIKDEGDLVKKVDAVDDVMETVIKKKGQVVFLDNEKLEDYHHIAVKTRF